MDRNPMDDEELVFFEDEDGKEYAFSLVRSFFYNGSEYALMREVTPEDSEEEDLDYIICEIVAGENGEDDEEFIPVEDEELADTLFEIATTNLNEEEEDE